MMRVLWVDDDGPQRFLYEEALIREDLGWELRWADCVRRGAELLANEEFDALILDLMLPRLPQKGRRSAALVWGGYWLLAWLRGAEIKDWAQPDEGRPAESQEDAGEYDFPRAFSPLRANRERLVDGRLIMWTAFSDEAVYQAIREIDPELRIHPKPVVADTLVGWLGAVK